MPGSACWGLSVIWTGPIYQYGATNTLLKLTTLYTFLTTVAIVQQNADKSVTKINPKGFGKPLGFGVKQKALTWGDERFLRGLCVGNRIVVCLTGLYRILTGVVKVD